MFGSSPVSVVFSIRNDGDRRTTAVPGCRNVISSLCTSRTTVADRGVTLTTKGPPTIFSAAFDVTMFPNTNRRKQTHNPRSSVIDREPSVAIKNRAELRIEDGAVY